MFEEKTKKLMIDRSIDNEDHFQQVQKVNISIQQSQNLEELDIEGKDTVDSKDLQKN